MSKLSPDEVAYLRLLPRSDLQIWLSDIAKNDPELAAQVLREVDDSAYVTFEKSEVADFFDMAPETIDLWIRKGMPFQSGGKGVKGRFDLRECSRWLASQKQIQPEANEEQIKVDIEYRKEKLRIQELNRKKMEGKLVDAEFYEGALMKAISLIRNGMDTLHKAFGNEVVEMVTGIVDEAESTLLEEIQQQE